MYAERKIAFVLILVGLLSTLVMCCRSSVGPEPDNMVAISPDGGEYSFGDDLVLRVPAGAVSTIKNISLRKLDRSQLSPIFEKRGVPVSNLLLCVEGKPDGMVFDKPVQLCVFAKMKRGEIPVVHEVSLANGKYTLDDAETVWDPDQDSLMISLKHFSSVAVEAVKGLTKDVECETAPCRCGRIKVEQSDKDLMCDNGDCQIVESLVSVTYLDCSHAPVEESVMREISPNCAPVLSLVPGTVILPAGEQTSVVANVRIGCQLLEGQDVGFSVEGPASLAPTDAATDANGEAYTIFKASDEEGTANVTARATVSYPVYTIYASAGGQSETVEGPPITKQLENSAIITIKKADQEWSGTMTYEDAVNLSSPVGTTDLVIRSTYDVDIHFSLSWIGSGSGKISGTATAAQEVNFENHKEDYGACFDLQPLDVPKSLDLVIDGSVLSDGHIWLRFTKPNPDSHFYSYERYFLCDLSGSSKPPEMANGPSSFFVPPGLSSDAVALKDGTYSCDYTLMGWSVYFMKESCTITLHREK